MNKLWWLGVLLSAQAVGADLPETPVNNLFDAMREHDAEKLLSQFTDKALLQRALPDGSVRQSDIKKFAKSIAQSTAFLDEHLLSVSVQQSGNLATVWTPYAFYLNEKLSHCGVNSFQVVKTQEGWKIQYLIDNSHQGDCQTFIKLHEPTN